MNGPLSQMSRLLSNANNALNRKIQGITYIYEKSLYELNSSHATLRKLQTIMTYIDFVANKMPEIENQLDFDDEEANTNGDVNMEQSAESNNIQVQQLPQGHPVMNDDQFSDISSVPLPSFPPSLEVILEEGNSEFLPKSILNEVEQLENERFWTLRSQAAKNEYKLDLQAVLDEIPFLETAEAPTPSLPKPVASGSGLNPMDALIQRFS